MKVDIEIQLPSDKEEIRKIGLIRFYRNITGEGLRPSKDVIDAALILAGSTVVFQAEVKCSLDEIRTAMLNDNFFGKIEPAVRISGSLDIRYDGTVILTVCDNWNSMNRICAELNSLDDIPDMVRKFTDCLGLADKTL